jgi:hypothetical protein
LAISLFHPGRILNILPTILPKENSVKDITGQKFGKLTVVRFVGLKNHKQIWECVCDCGRTKSVQAGNLKKKSGPTVSCGCYRDENLRQVGKATVVHGHNRPTQKRTRTHNSWRTMKQRCENPNAGNYHNYGGAGITVCERWKSFVNFLVDMGIRPEGTTLDRIDPFGNYEPGNCRWATYKEQSNNTRKQYANRHLIAA